MSKPIANLTRPAPANGDRAALKTQPEIPGTETANSLIRLSKSEAFWMRGKAA